MEQEYQEYINLPYFKIHKAPTYEEWLKIRNRQQPLFVQDLRSEYQRQLSKERKNQEQMSENLYKNQHLWNWTSPFTNIKVNKNNANSMFDFNKEAAISTFTTASGLANPVITAKSTLGSLIGAGLGDYIAGNTGSLMGGLVGGMAGINKPKSKLVQRNNNSGKPVYGVENKEQAMSNVLSGHKKFIELITSDYWKNHLKKQGMTDREINHYIINLLLNVSKATQVLMPRKNYNSNSFGRHVIFQDNTGKVSKMETHFPFDVDTETVIHEVAHAANKNGGNYKIGEVVDSSPNEVTLHNKKHQAKINEKAMQESGSLLSDLLNVEEQRSRAIVTHQKLFEYNTTWDDVQKVMLGKILGMSVDQMNKAAKFINDNLYVPDKYTTPSNIKLIFLWFDPESMTDFMHNVRQYIAPIGIGGIYGLNEHEKNSKN